MLVQFVPLSFFLYLYCTNIQGCNREVCVQVKIIVVKTARKVDALIREAKISEVPSFHDQWDFDFAKQLKRLLNATAYILVREDTPAIIEGCMIFQLVNKIRPVMTYLEVAPHNRTDNKKHDLVAGCLIAYAFKLSLMRGVGAYIGSLSFKVGEEKRMNEEKLINLYIAKYHAVQLIDCTILEISGEAGEALIQKYLT